MRKEQTSHKNEHNTLMCFPLEPVFTRDKRRLPNFNAEITGTSIMQKVEAGRSWYVLPEEDIIRKKAKKL